MTTGPIRPGPGCESVWAYPRPPRLEPESRPIRIVLGGATIVETIGALRILETSHPPVYYLPPGDIAPGVISVARDTRGSYCEWKGQATYLDVATSGPRARCAAGAAWRYDRPADRYAALAGFVAFYAQRMDACFVGDEQVVPQPGDFYGGWATSWTVGPFKGSPGTRGW